MTFLFYSLPKSCAGTKPPMPGCEMDGLQPVPSVGGFSGCPIPTCSPGQRHFWELPMNSPSASSSSWSSRETLPLLHGCLSSRWSQGSSPVPVQEDTPREHLILTFVVCFPSSLALKETNSKNYELLRREVRVTFFYSPSKALAPCPDLSQELYVPENWLPSHFL